MELLGDEELDRVSGGGGDEGFDRDVVREDPEPQPWRDTVTPGLPIGGR